MVTPQERKQYRAIGGRLAVVLRQRQGQRSSAAALQAIAADLVGERTELLLPLKDLVSRPGFELLAAKAGSGRGVVERHALLADLERTFSPAVIAALEELLGGFLDLPATSDVAASEVRSEPSSAPRAPKPAPQRRQSAGPSRTAEPAARPQTPTRTRNPIALGVLVCLATATVVAAGTAAIRNPLVCSALGFCQSTGASTAVQQTLDAARRAVADLESATSLTSYRNAAAELERELQRLLSETLTPEQRQQQEELADISRKAQAAVLQDEADQEQLQRAAAALSAARQLKGAEQQVQLATAEQALQSISTGGFGAAEAIRLRAEVAAIQAEQQPTQDAPVAETPPPPPSSRSAAPSAPPAPKPPARQAPEASSGGEWRNQPLF
jgi:hypothetical protein